MSPCSLSTSSIKENHQHRGHTDSWVNSLVSVMLSCVLSQFSSVAQSCPTLCDPMNRNTPGLPVHHKLPEFTQTHAHRVGDAIQPSHPLLSPSPPAPNPSQNQGLFQRVNSLHEVAQVLEFQLQHQFQTQQWPQDWKRSVFIPIPKKGNPKECSNYCTIALISHAS